MREIDEGWGSKREAEFRVEVKNMFCTRCGAKMADDAQVCSNCSSVSASTCQVCGMHAPTRHVDFYENIGMFFARTHQHMTGNLCRSCIGKYFKGYTLTTLFLGWWGLISFFVTPFMLIGNLVNYMKTRSLPGPNPALTNAWQSQGIILPKSGRGLTFKVIYGIVIWTVILAVIVQNYPRFLEKYSPRLNAYLHSGSPTSDADTDYRIDHFTQAFASYKTLIDAACPEKATFKECRSKILAARPALDDMRNQYQALLAGWTAEKSGRTIPDSCKLPMDQYFSAMDRYWIIEDKNLKLIGSVDPESDANVRAAAPKLEKLLVEENTALTNLQGAAIKISSESGAPCENY
jgi:hypothetical protein